MNTDSYFSFFLTKVLLIITQSGKDATVTAYDTYTLPENAFTAPAGKTFSEWRVTQDSYSEMLQPGDEVVIGADTTVTAIWTSAITSWAALQEAIGNAANGDTIYLHAE